MPGKTFDRIPAADRPALLPPDLNVVCGNGSPVQLRGRAVLSLTIQGVKYEGTFHVTDDNTRGILGTDFLEEYDGQVLVGRNRVILNNREIKVYDANGMSLSHRVTVNASVVIPPKEQLIVWGRIHGRKHERLDDVPVLVEGTTGVFRQQGVVASRALATPRDGWVPVPVHNLSGEPQRVAAGSTIAIVQSVIDAEYFNPERQRPLIDDLLEKTGGNEEKGMDDISAMLNAMYGQEMTVPGEAGSSADQATATSGDESSTSPSEKKEETETCESEGPTTRPAAKPPYECDWHCGAVHAKYAELPADKQTSEGLPEHVKGMFEKYVPALKDPWHKVYFHELIENFSDVFAKDKYDLGQATIVKHHIDTADEDPVKQKPRRLPFEQHQEIEAQVKKLADIGIIQPSSSKWASNVLLVKKKDNTWRMCVDYRELNRKTHNKDQYMIPRIDDTLDALGGAQLFCTLDLLQGYHQVQLTEECRHKTAFLTPHMTPNLWEFVCMPFGITGGPSTFQRLMDSLLQGLEYRIALAYLDDVIVFGSGPVEVMDRLAVILSRMRRANLRLKPSKCTFFEPETLFLGHIVSGKGVKCDPAKVEAVKSWRRPTTNRQALSFAAFVNYYNRLVPHFSEISRPLYELGRKRKFVWTDEHEQAFQKLRECVINAPVVGYPRMEGKWILDTDASAYAMGAVLSQMQKLDDSDEEHERVIAYGSKSLERRQQLYCARRRELLAIAFFVERFRPYLYGRKVTIRTDHASLKYIKTMRNIDDQAARWLEKLGELQYTIEVRAGTKHVNADALSRFPTCGGKRCMCPEIHELERVEMEKFGILCDDWTMLPTNRAKVNVLAAAVQVEFTSSSVDEFRYIDAWTRIVDQQRIPKPNGEARVYNDDNVATIHAIQFVEKWSAQEVAQAQESDADTSLLYHVVGRMKGGRPEFRKIEAEGPAAMHYYHDFDRLQVFSNGVMYRRWESSDGREIRWQMIVPAKFREVLFNHLHTALNAGHMGFNRTMRKLRMKYYWYRMAEDVRAWIRICDACNLRKAAPRPPRAPMQVSLVGDRGQKVAIDLMGPLNTTKSGNRYIMVVVDHFTKYAMAIPLAECKAEDIAQAFVTRWVSIFGAPQQIHTDRGRNVDGELMRELSRLLDADKTRTSGYHPQGDGQVERQNRTILNMMNSYAAQEPENWDQHLSTVLIGYNSTRHSSTGFEPNRLAMGCNISMPVDLMMPADPNVTEKPVNQYVYDLSRNLRYAYELARENLKRAATVQKRYYDRKANFHPYKVGDAVLLKVFRWNKGEKFRNKYEGPYYVVRVIADATYVLMDKEDGRPRTLHYDSLKPCVNGGMPEGKKGWIYRYAQDARYRYGQVKDGEQQADLPPITEEQLRRTGWSGVRGWPEWLIREEIQQNQVEDDDAHPHSGDPANDKATTAEENSKFRERVLAGAWDEGVHDDPTRVFDPPAVTVEDPEADGISPEVPSTSSASVSYDQPRYADVVSKNKSIKVRAVSKPLAKITAPKRHRKTAKETSQPTEADSDRLPGIPQAADESPPPRKDSRLRPRPKQRVPAQSTEFDTEKTKKSRHQKPHRRDLADAIQHAILVLKD